MAKSSPQRSLEPNVLWIRSGLNQCNTLNKEITLRSPKVFLLLLTVSPKALASPFWIQAPAPFSNLRLRAPGCPPHLPQLTTSRLGILPQIVNRSILVSAKCLAFIVVYNSLTVVRLQGPWSLGV
jgi:hypothetical protein